MASDLHYGETFGGDNAEKTEEQLQRLPESRRCRKPTILYINNQLQLFISDCMTRICGYALISQYHTGLDYVDVQTANGQQKTF
jgi:hypothetical protein